MEELSFWFLPSSMIGWVVPATMILRPAGFDQRFRLAFQHQVPLEVSLPSTPTCAVAQ
jgi:hypothetical protein